MSTRLPLDGLPQEDVQRAVLIGAKHITAFIREVSEDGQFDVRMLAVFAAHALDPLRGATDAATFAHFLNDINALVARNQVMQELAAGRQKQ